MKSLSSLKKHISVPCDVVVWNNGGPSDLIEKHLTEQSPSDFSVFLFQSKKNLGFAPGVNRASEVLPERSFDALLLLNSDAILLSSLDKTQFEALMNLNAVVGLKVYNDELKTHRQKSARSFPNVLTSVTSRQSILAKLFPKNPWTKKYLGNSLNENVLQKVDWVSGCALFCPIKIWKALGAFDEAYFFGVEDVDFGRKAQKSKIPVYFYPFLEVLHIGGLAATKRAWKSDFYHHLGMWNYFLKWSHPLSFFFGIFIFCGIFLRFATRRLVQIRTDF